MPVRGHGFYQKPIKVKWSEGGRKRTRAFHGIDAATEDADYLTSQGRSWGRITDVEIHDTENNVRYKIEYGRRVEIARGPGVDRDGRRLPS